MNTSQSTVSSKFISRCVRPVGMIRYTNGDYKDTQMIAAGRTAEELIAIRFAHCGGKLPAGWAVSVTMFN